ncbi:helix-turn-helix transcriptional regulator [Hyphococcus formosus]|uniref:helix-turn-helix domain-containing protein n=1 Tax=Hyphococcus formosus TaxID=3143534 RepID=UPI00398B49B5
MKTTYTDKYQGVVDFLLEARKTAGLTQEELAAKLRRPQSYISKYERVERRLDIVEFADIVSALEIPSKDVLAFLDALISPSHKRGGK